MNRSATKLTSRHLTRRSWIARHPVAAYLLLACGITWLCWMPALAVATRHGYLLPTIDHFVEFVKSGFTDQTHVLVVTIFTLAVYGPLMAALIVTRATSGATGVAALWHRITRWRVAWRWYLIVVLISMALAIVPFLLITATGLAGFDRSGLMALAPFIAPLLLWQLLTSGLGEEPGWRGLLLQRLQARFGGEKHVWLLGLAWAAWHYPFTAWYTASSMVGMPASTMIVPIVLALAGHTMSLIGLTYIYVWLINRTGSVFLAILFHALANVANAVMLAAIARPEPPITLMVAFMPWLVVIVMTRVLGKDRFPGRPGLPARDRQ